MLYWWIHTVNRRLHMQTHTEYIYYTIYYIYVQTYSHHLTHWRTQTRTYGSCQSKSSLHSPWKLLDFSNQQPRFVYRKLWLTCTIQHDIYLLLFFSFAVQREEIDFMVVSLLSGHVGLIDVILSPFSTFPLLSVQTLSLCLLRSCHGDAPICILTVEHCH